ncbi:transcription factor bHLH128-like [Rhododendron vialii]|uniref:transcription factor bHLH128-like n=1 Tax=Rhododendron vialii TaxID=182163 RepID=UPI00265EDA20|nr:transcription factor bHLH128-like [Rhododendron vialii]
MYPSSSSPPSHPSTNNPPGLTRYGSAPCSFLTTAVDSVTTTAVAATRDFSVLGPHHQPTHNNNNANHPNNIHSSINNPTPSNASQGGSRPYCLNAIATTVGGELTAAGGGSRINLNSKSGGGGGGGLVRHSSSPAGFLDHLNATNNSATGVSNGNGFPLTRSIGSCNSKGVSDTGHGISRLSSQLSFTRDDALSCISGERENGRGKTAQSYATTSFGIGSWDDSNAGFFSASPGKQARGDRCANTAESQFQFSLSQTDLEMSTTENRLHIPYDSVPCKIRAKRGFATHPRSIAERDRRTRINGKLKKLQDYVPNLDKQTSYADMLDLAVQHIKGLQNQVQKLKEEVENCTCGCKQTK